MAQLLQHRLLILMCLWGNLGCSTEKESKPRDPLQKEESTSSDTEIRVDTETVKHEEVETTNPGDSTPTEPGKSGKSEKTVKPDEPKKPIEHSRNNPPPRAKFAAEDLKILDPLLSNDLPNAFKMIAEIFQFEGFRAVPASSALDSSEPHRVLLLGYSIKQLAKTVDLLAALAKSISEEGPGADKHALSSFHLLPVVSLQAPKPNPDRTIDLDKSKIVVQIDAAHSPFIKQVPLNAKVQKFWPEALQLELSFGADRILLIFPSVITFSDGPTTDLLEGRTLLQTPWILRALEGETLSALWQAVSTSEVEQTNQQMGKRELLYRIVLNHLFESIWDERSVFFPKHNAFRIVDKFQGPTKIFTGSEYFGYRDLQFSTVGDLRSQIAALMKTPGFTFENK